MKCNHCGELISKEIESGICEEIEVIFCGLDCMFKYNEKLTQIECQEVSRSDKSTDQKKKET